MADQKNNPYVPAVIAGGSNLLGGAIGAISTAVTNKKQREWNEKMYGIQRRDALADWTMQNEYNSPQAQMQRLKEAGLNPHLVYGGGATTTAGPTRSTDVKGWQPQSPVKGEELGAAASGAMSAYFNTQVQQLQIDNMKKQGTILDMDATLKNTANIMANLGILSKTFDYNMKSNLAPWTEEAAKQKVNQLINSINTDQRRTAVAEGQLSLGQERLQLSLKEFEVRKLLAYQSYDKMAQEMLNMAAQRGLTQTQIKEAEQRIENLKKEGIAKDWENMQRNRGTAPNDPWYIRKATEMLEKTFDIFRFNKENDKFRDTLYEREKGQTIINDWKKKFPYLQ